jgi:hypothetical protein
VPRASIRFENVAESVEGIPKKKPEEEGFVEGQE